ncbi:MAG: hypothetical protein JOY80_13165 [Candidatus Dormibacteraeota bacterium]|nr:hypothetical protein [Candidatus Dormibacteraeota bacterium]
MARTLGAVTLPVTTELIERTASALGSGGWRFTPRQLYYATCAAAETPPGRSAANGLIALGVLLVLVAIILLHFPAAFAAVLALAGVCVIAGVVARVTYRPTAGRVLAISYSEFERLLAQAAVDRLIDVAAWRSPRLAGDGPVIVCDTAETAAAIDANRPLAGIGELPVLGPPGEAPLEGCEVVAIHDASPHGCALPLDLQDAGARVFDAGVRPRWVDGTGFQELEGAPARLPRDLSGLCADAEIGWLASGRRVEAAVLEPLRLATLVTVALEEKEKRKAHPDVPMRDTPGLLPSLPALP